MKQILHITTKKKWYDMEAAGIKKHEYREINAYWITRLIDKSFFNEDCDFDAAWIEKLKSGLELSNCDEIMGKLTKKYDVVSNTNGYGKHRPNIEWKHEGITIGKPNPAWCEPEDADKIVFILKIGELIKSE